MASANAHSTSGAGHAGAWPQREPPVQKELLERVSFWAEQLMAEPLNYAAEETLRQSHFGGKGRAGGGQRTILSQFITVRFGDSARDQAEFRDVYNVDGKPVQSEAELAAKWPKLAAAQSAQELGGLVQDGSKYRLSPERFTGLSRLAARFAERHWPKMKYFFAQDTSDPPSPHVLIGYRQVEGEGLMVVDDQAVRPAGQAWIEPDDGHIVRIEEEFSVKDSRYFTSVEFTKTDELGAWVPAAVTVRVFEKGRLTLENVYSYSNFRRLRAEQSGGSGSTPR
jgi:hypothetical protein